MTLAGRTLDDVGGALPWTAFRSFVSSLGVSSALFRSMYPEQAAWSSAARTNALLADVFDAVQALSYAFACANTGKGKPRPKKPKPYPRPGAKRDEGRIGDGAIPIRDFESWWNGGEEHEG